MNEPIKRGLGQPRSIEQVIIKLSHIHNKIQFQKVTMKRRIEINHRRDHCIQLSVEFIMESNEDRGRTKVESLFVCKLIEGRIPSKNRVHKYFVGVEKQQPSDQGEESNGSIDSSDRDFICVFKDWTKEISSRVNLFQINGQSES
jgi:hypothetical protein